MISDTHREMRDLLRARLLLVSRSIRCQRSVGGAHRSTTWPRPRSSLELPRPVPTSTRRNGSCSRPRCAGWRKELREHVLATPAAQRLVWVPGIKRMVAYTLLLEIDDIHRFPTAKQFHSYLVASSRDRTILAGRPITGALAMGTGTRNSRFITPPSGRCSTSRKSAPSSTASTAARGNPSRGR